MITVQQQQSRAEQAAGLVLAGRPVLPFVPSTPALQEFHTHKRLFVAFPTHTLTTQRHTPVLLHVCAQTHAHTQANIQTHGSGCTDAWWQGKVS